MIYIASPPRPFTTSRWDAGGRASISHVPGGDYYAVTDPEECFATPHDAEAAGYRASEV